jgi:PAS domain S-box-containing protein
MAIRAGTIQAEGKISVTSQTASRPTYAGANVIGFSRRMKFHDSRRPACTACHTGHPDTPQPEELLSHRLNFTRDITRNLVEGICAFDRHSRIVFMNPAAEAALGWSESELKGQQMHQGRPFCGVGQPQQPARGCPLLRVLHCRETIAIEDDFFIRKDGTQIPVSYQLSPITAGDEVLGALLTFQNLTQPKLLAQQLRHSQKPAAVGHLTAGVVHDCGNLLTIVTGYTEQFLGDRRVNPSLRADIEHIHKAANLSVSLARHLRTRRPTVASERKVLALNPLVLHA